MNVLHLEIAVSWELEFGRFLANKHDVFPPILERNYPETGGTAALEVLYINVFRMMLHQNPGSR